MYGRIAEDLKAPGGGGSPGRILLLVPDQFTLQAERNAFRYLNVPGLLDLEVLSMSNLGRRLLSESTGDGEPYINQYGKNMLLSRLLRHGKAQLSTLKNMEGSPEFAQKLSDIIAEMKNSGVTPDGLNGITGAMEEDSLLKRKLSDISVVYRGYEERISGNYLDSSDHLRRLAEKIPRSDFIANSRIWLLGFDYFSPLMTDVIIGLAERSPEMNVLLTAEPGNSFFALTNRFIETLCLRAEEGSIPFAARSLPEGCGFDRPAEIAYIERALFAWSAPAFSAPPTSSEPSLPVMRFAAAANYYAEAETAAVRITELVRDHGFRYGDILVLCNDQDVRGRIISRVFSRYGLPLFMDRRKSVEHSPAPEYILSMISASSGGRRYDDVFRMLKTGLTGLPSEGIEELENYCLRYGIAGKLWDKPFTFGLEDRDEGYAEALENSRKAVVGLLSGFDGAFKGAKTAADKARALYVFLVEKARLPEKIEEMEERLLEEGKLEYSAEMAGIWDVVSEVIGQMSSVLGDLPMPADEFERLLRTGFASIKMGMLPTSPDQIVLGSMQRTRSGDVRAVFVLGANDGVLPAFKEDTSILNDEELKLLAEKHHILGRGEDQRLQEEQLAIYRNLSKPGDKLFVSYAVSDEGGNEIRPSLIFQRLRRLFPDVPVEKDIAGGLSDPMELVQSREASLSHLTEALRRFMQGEPLHEVWRRVLGWYGANDPDSMGNVIDGLTFRNRSERIGGEELEALLGGTVMVTSPSALEKYSHCPFSWFLDRGIRLTERRVHELDRRNVGDVYHEVLMHYGMELSKDGLPISDPRSAWRQVTKEDVYSMTDEIFGRVSEGFREGLLAAGDYERYRGDRMKRVIAEVAWALTEQVRDGGAESMKFEAGFGEGADIPPIEAAYEGRTLLVRGKIDRLDVLQEGYARIVDYKSGQDSFSLEDVMSGWQMQLMLYLKAAASEYKPAGVCYFSITEPRVEDDGKKNIEEEIRKQFRMSGVSSVPGLPLKHLDESDLEALQDTVTELVGGLCEGMLGGDISVDPMVAKKIKTADGSLRTACTFCGYSSICSYDGLFE